MTTEPVPHPRTGLRWALAMTALLAFCLCLGFTLVGNGSSGDLDYLGQIEHAVTSKYSTIRVRKEGNIRTLTFVRDNGDEVVESMVNLKQPHDLMINYTRFMFLSYVFRPKQEKVLIVGLGGGAMVHFMQHYDPKVKVDVVEIDPVVVNLADKYFDVRTGGNVNVITKDALVFLEKTATKYDVIYMDAFLKPSPKTDPTGKPLAQQTLEFYQDVQKKLTPDGLVVFNINPHDDIHKDVKTIKAAFPRTYIFDLPKDAGLVVVGSMSPKLLDAKTIEKEGRALDGRFEANYSFKAMTWRLSK